MRVVWCAGSDQIADALTKPLGAPLLREFCKKVFYIKEHKSFLANWANAGVNSEK